MRAVTFLCLCFFVHSFAEDTGLPSYFDPDTVLSGQLAEIVRTSGLDKDFDVGEDGTEQISLAVIDLTSERPAFAGFHAHNFIYPASVYKMYVAAEVLKQVSEGRLTLDSLIQVRSPNDVDKTKEITSDPRPLLRDGDTVTVNYLLDLMITRSDNAAANCLIDLARRESINALIYKYNWEGSEVTRKFLSRKFEDPGYQKIRGTETCALHAADFMYLIETNRLVNPWVSMQLKSFLARQLDDTKYAAGLPENTMFYHKTGWYAFWTNDVGIVSDGRTHYIIACFLPLKKEEAQPKFIRLAAEIHRLMQERQRR